MTKDKTKPAQGGFNDFIELDGKTYKISIPKAIKALIKYAHDNPCLGNDYDYNDNETRLKIITEGLKDLDKSDVKKMISDNVDEDIMTVNLLIDNNILK